MSTSQSICAGCDSGEPLPPFILYKGKNMYCRWMVGSPARARYGISESGWMDPAEFLSWFLKLFMLSHLIKTGPVLLFFDGHYSHISLELIRAARQNNVHFLCLPPNNAHFTAIGCGSIFTSQDQLEINLEAIQAADKESEGNKGNFSKSHRSTMGELQA